MAKPAGADCNLDCAYCFYLSRKALYPGSSLRMPDEVLEQYVRQVIEAHGGHTATIAWQGGEPTLVGLDFFRRALELVERHRPAEMRVEHSIQTNGILLDRDWCEFLRDNRFLVGLSIDGPAAMHDAYRVDMGGGPTHAKVREAARLLTDHGVEFNVLCAVHSSNADSPQEVYRYLRDEVGARYIQFIPIVERAGMAPTDDDGELVSERSVTPAAWGRFLSAIFDEWVRRDVGTVFVQAFDAALASWLGVPPTLCVFAETCGDAVVVEHNGDLYSCDHFVESRFRLGNITEVHVADLAASPRQRTFGLAKRDTLPRQCRECPVRFACNGECPRNRFVVTQDGESGLNYLCAGYMAFFAHIDRPMRLMADLLRRGRSAEQVMAVVADGP
jgi:uncharacterized protein